LARKLARTHVPVARTSAIPTTLIFVRFVGASEVEGPVTKAEWQVKLRDMHRALGIYHRLPAYVRDAFVDVSGDVPVAA